METVSIDVVSPFSPTSRRGNRFIFTVVDNFSNMQWLFATPDETAETTAALLLDFFLAQGFPTRILSDRGSNFTSAVVREVLRLLRVKHATTSAWHPQTDGKNEVSHRLLLSQIRAFLSQSDFADWGGLLPFFSFAANTSPLGTSSLTPFDLYFGRSARTPTDRELNPSEVFVPPDDVVRSAYAVELRARLRRAHEFLAAFRARQSAAMIARRKHFSLPVPFGVGDVVIVHSPKRVNGLSAKLVNQFTGPFRVVAQHRLADGSVAPNMFDLVQARTKARLDCVNVSRLHKFRVGSEAHLLDTPTASSSPPSSSTSASPPAPSSSSSSASPPAPSSSSSPASASDARPWVIDDFVVDDMVVVRHPTRSGAFCVGKIIHVDYESLELSIHYWGSSSANLLTATLKPEFFDPADKKSLFTDRPLARHSPALSLFSLSDVLAPSFALTRRKTIPPFLLRDLARLGFVGLVLSCS